jgi:hypothetical protein
VLIAAQPSRFGVHLSKKLDSLLARLDNQCMMHDSQNGALEWVGESQKDAYYCSCAMLHGV